MENAEKDFSYTRKVKEGEYSGLFTVRGDNAKKFIDNMAAGDDFMEKRGIVAKPPRTNDYASYKSYSGGSANTTTATAPKGDTKMCPIHNVEMFGKEGQYGFFYSHKKEDGTWCNGKPKVKSY